MQRFIRTDLAVEARESLKNGDFSGGLPDGVDYACREEDGLRIERITVSDKSAAEQLCKPMGTYSTITPDALFDRAHNAFPRTAQAIADELRGMLPSEGTVLVAGLGNECITPDALGPWCLRHVLVTRHLRRQLPEQFGQFRTVAAVAAGVTGTTGLESAELVRAVCRAVSPAAVIAVDALAARESARLCRTVQLASSGISPGSGVGNRRARLDRASLGVPVIAVGVPTVVDAATLAADLAEKAGAPLPEDAPLPHGLVVTPRDIDQRVRETAQLIGVAIDLALHPYLSLEDVEMMLA